jgi:hypothetical protein
MTFSIFLGSVAAPYAGHDEGTSVNHYRSHRRQLLPTGPRSAGPGVANLHGLPDPGRRKLRARPSSPAWSPATTGRGVALIWIKGAEEPDQLPMPPFEIRRGVGAMGRFDLLLAISVVWLFILLSVMVYIIVI